MALTFILSLVGEKRLMKPVRYLFPNNVFVFGKEVEKHTKRQSLRQNILWGIIISSVIGIVTGLAVWMITK